MTEHDAQDPTTDPATEPGAADEAVDAAGVTDPAVADPAVPVADGAAAPAEPDAAPADEPAEPETPLAAAERERDEYLDALRRKQAEFENFRKRMARDGIAQRTAGKADVAERLLDVLDDFDRTLEHAAPEVDPGFLKGVTLVHDKLVRVLGEVGLTRVGTSGEPFDPNRHEAVQQVEADEPGGEPAVHQVLRPGYELDGRVVRAAMVVVAQ